MRVLFKPSVVRAIFIKYFKTEIQVEMKKNIYSLVFRTLICLYVSGFPDHYWVCGR